jgi:uncharacterized protein (TIGR02300 family)
LAKAEWGDKRQCPKCGTRFYDLGESDPISCISCEHAFNPEIILKSKTHSIELITDKKKEEAEAEAEAEGEDEEADLLDDEALLIDDTDDDIDVDDNTVVLSDDDVTNVAAVVDAPNAKPTVDE